MVCALFCTEVLLFPLTSEVPPWPSSQVSVCGFLNGASGAAFLSWHVLPPVCALTALCAAFMGLHGGSGMSV